jgi:hypothetical protein
MQQLSPGRQSQSPRCYKHLCVLLSLVSASSGLVTRYSPVGTTRLYVDGSSDTDRNTLFSKEDTENDDAVDDKTPQSHFGDVMSLKRPAVDSAFGDVVSMKRPPGSDSGAMFAVASGANIYEPQVDTTDDPNNTLAMQKRRNVGIGTISILLAVSNYLWQFAHPITPVQLLFSMEQNSVPVSLIGTNNRPTVVDFWAPWYV